MHRVVGLLPGAQVAARVAAVVGRSLESVVIVDVALRALQIGVTVGQRESGGAVIENRRVPRRWSMAVRTIRRCENRSCARVRRIIRLLPSRQMAARVAAVCSGDLQMVVVADVALLAGDVCMAQGQRKVDWRRGVIARETCAQPAVERLMASLAAARRKIGRILGMRRIRGALPVFQVAALTVRRKAEENTGGRLLVAILALHSSVGAEQREAVHVVFHLLHGNVPALNRMTLLAIRSVLPTVHIVYLVAVRALLAHVGEDRLHVTLHTRNFFVHPAQRIVCFVVIEFRNGPNGTPTRSGVTVFAGYGKRPVGVARRLILWIAQLVNGHSTRCDRTTACGGEHKQSPKSELE